MTRCQGTRVSAGQFLRITAPTDRAQPPATLAMAPYVVTLPAGTPRTTAWTLDSKAVGIPLAARRRPQPRTVLRDADALLLLSAASAACAGLCNRAARTQMSNARAAQRCSHQLAVPCLLGQQSHVALAALPFCLKPWQPCKLGSSGIEMGDRCTERNAAGLPPARLLVPGTKFARVSLNKASTRFGRGTMCSGSSTHLFIVTHHLDELLIVDLAVAVGVRFAEDLLGLLFRELLALAAHDIAQLGGGDGTAVVLV